jgi:hypothetical protein
MGAGASSLPDSKYNMFKLSTLLTYHFEELKVEGGSITKAQLISGLQDFLRENDCKESDNSALSPAYCEKKSPKYFRRRSGCLDRSEFNDPPKRIGTPSARASREKPIVEDPRRLTQVPHLSNKLRLTETEAQEKATKDLDTVDLILWRLAEYVAQQIDSKTSTGGATNPATISWAMLFRLLDLDCNKIITRDEWAIVLRRQVGVGSKVSDADLDIIFNDINRSNDGGFTLNEFAEFARHKSSRSTAQSFKEVKKIAQMASVTKKFNSHPMKKKSNVGVLPSTDASS